MTYTIVGRCARTGVAGRGDRDVLAGRGRVLSVCEVGRGAVSSQAAAGQRLGALATRPMEAGLSPEGVVQELAGQ